MELAFFFSLVIRIYCSMIGSTDEDMLLLEESDDNVYVNIRHTKDFRFVTVNTFSTTSSKVIYGNTLLYTKDLLKLIYLDDIMIVTMF